MNPTPLRVRLPVELKSWLATTAKADGMSLNATIVRTLQRFKGADAPFFTIRPRNGLFGLHYMGAPAILDAYVTEAAAVDAAKVMLANMGEGPGAIFIENPKGAAA